MKLVRSRNHHAVPRPPNLPQSPACRCARAITSRAPNRSRSRMRTTRPSRPISRMQVRSGNYVTRRQSLKLLGELLLDRSNFAIMTRYIASPAHLKDVMSLLRDPSASIQVRSPACMHPPACYLPHATSRTQSPPLASRSRLLPPSSLAFSHLLLSPLALAFSHLLLSPSLAFSHLLSPSPTLFSRLLSPSPTFSLAFSRLLSPALTFSATSSASSCRRWASATAGPFTPRTATPRCTSGGRAAGGGWARPTSSAATAAGCASSRRRSPRRARAGRSTRRRRRPSGWRWPTWWSTLPSGCCSRGPHQVSPPTPPRTLTAGLA